MGEEAKEVHDQSSREIEQITAQTNGCPRDLLKRFKAGSNHHLFRHHSTRSSELVGAGATGEDDDEEIGLNLGLSLGGRFGVNPRENTNNNNNNNSSLRRSSSTNINININNNNNNNNNNYDNSNNRLVRSSSSIAGLTTLVRDEESVVGQQQQQQQAAALCSSLIRTSSLPMETEEEWRKRKELQTLRRMEAKRKRSEKQQQKNMNMIRACGGGKDGKDRASLERSCEEDKRVVEVVVEDHHRSTSSKQQQQQGVVGAAFGLSSWAEALVRGMDASSLNNGTKVNNVVVDGVGSQPQGSLGSQGSTSSGISESLQGISNCTESRSPSSVQSLPEQQIEQKPMIVLPRPMPEKSSTPLRTEGENHAKKKPKLVDQNGVVEETGMKVMEEMPCVSTKGDGPNGKKIEGFLYKYRKGEEVRIVCVCHGNFLSPAEFVKHAGGGDVAHPLRHIVVNPSPSFLS